MTSNAVLIKPWHIRHIKLRHPVINFEAVFVFCLMKDSPVLSLALLACCQRLIVHGELQFHAGFIFVEKKRKMKAKQQPHFTPLRQGRKDPFT